MLTHLCRYEAIKNACLIQHQVCPTASTLVLHPFDRQATSRRLVFARVLLLTTTTRAVWHLILS